MYTKDIENALGAYYQNSKYFFMTQVKNGSTFVSDDLLILDGVAILKSWVKTKMIGYEIKVSRSDFLKDEKRIFYKQYVNEFYFICPDGLIKKEELPDDVGLCYVQKDLSIKTIRRAKYKDNKPNVDMLMYIIFSKLDSTSQRPSYRYPIEDYINNKITDKDLAYKFSCKMLNRIQSLDRDLKNATEKKTEYEEIIKVVQDKIDDRSSKGIIDKNFYSRSYAGPRTFLSMLDKVEDTLKASSQGLSVKQKQALSRINSKYDSMQDDLKILLDLI